MIGRICKTCGELKPYQAFGLCRRCYSRQYYRKFKKLIAKICACCGIKFTTSKFNPTSQRFCSKKCTHKGAISKICRYCGKAYKVTKDREKISKYCSRSCLAKAQWTEKDQEERLNWSHKLNKIRWSKLTPDERSLAMTGEKNPHFGKEVSEYTRQKIGKANTGKTAWNKNLTKDDPRVKKCTEHLKGRNNPMFGRTPSQKCSYGRTGIRKDIGHFVRSTWEANIARIFRLLGIHYEYEPENFDLGQVSYTPDFKLTDNYFCEVKGFMREESKKRIELFREMNSDKDLFLIDKTVYKLLESEFKEKIPNWE